MKKLIQHLFLTTVLVISLAPIFMHLTTTAVVNTKEIWVLAGQSNANGDSADMSIDPILDAPDTRIQRYDQWQWDSPAGFYVKELLQYPDNGDGAGGISMSQTFGKQRLAAGATDIIILDVAVGGTSFTAGHWTIDGPIFNDMVVRINQAKLLNPTFEFKGIIWHQGEGDLERSTKWYLIHLTQLITRMRILTESPDSLFILGTMNATWVSNNSSAYNVDTAHRTVCDYVPNCGLVVLDDLLPSLDGIHFTSTGFRTMGTRYGIQADDLL